ncbi:MAG: hypothetical protein KGK07_16035 [Chloroflexota bacterium]|nr:hypothetical protein [Chloroflexota bacterium]
MAVRHSPVDAYGSYKVLHLAAATTKVMAGGALVDTTSATAVAAPGSATVVVGSVANLRVGMRLAITDGVGVAELVVVTAFDPVGVTFTAVFANTHSGTYSVRSLVGTWLGPVIFNALGTAMTLTLYDGHPSLGGQTLAVITPASAPFPFAVACDQGLFYTYTGTTAGDVSVHYVAMPL